MASPGPQLQMQLAYKSWLGASNSDCHLMPKAFAKNGSSFQILEMTLQRYQFQNHKVAENTDSAFHPSKINLMSIKDSTGIWWLKVSLHCDSAAFRQLNSIHKVVHWDKWTLKKSIIFCKVYLKYTSDIQLKYA